MKTKTTGLLFVMCGFLLSITGCGPHRYLCEPGDGCFTLADYEDTVNQWVAHDELHDRFISQADIHAVFLSWELRQAYLDALRDRAAVEPAYFERQKDREIKQFESGNEFHIGLYCYQKEWYRITGENPIWRLTLRTDRGDEVRPVLIEEIEIPPDQAWKYLEFLTQGRKVYRAVFPRTTENGSLLLDKETRWFELRCHSMLGTLTMHWDVGPIPLYLK
ncbi:hypothetical protein JXA80_05805 [bacterium]|nr:hypothetical protein [candidate division CSSED10-310 bacterium]